MADLRFTLVSDGPADKALIPILRWLLQQSVDGAIQSDWADLRRLREPPSSLADKIVRSIELYPCDLLFVHRDAERETRQSRVNEIEASLIRAGVAEQNKPVVAVVPIRMQEAWFLFDAAAIRRAAGNPNGTETLELPRIRTVERLPDPKEVLYELLRQASGLHGRRLKDFRVSKHAADVSSFISDFAALRVLLAFRMLEDDIRDVVMANGWNR